MLLIPHQANWNTTASPFQRNSETHFVPRVNKVLWTFHIKHVWLPQSHRVPSWKGPSSVQQFSTYRPWGSIAQFQGSPMNSFRSYAESWHDLGLCRLMGQTNSDLTWLQLRQLALAAVGTWCFAQPPWQVFREMSFTEEGPWRSGKVSL
jgi:hypothetical protein